MNPVRKTANINNRGKIFQGDLNKGLSYGMKAELNYIRVAPRKMRLLADLVRRKRVGDASSILKFSTKKGAQFLLKLLNSAIANAKNNFGRDSENLYISRLTVDQGPVFKRSMPKARGMASLIRKKTSHVSLVLGDK